MPTTRTALETEGIIRIRVKGTPDDVREVHTSIIEHMNDLSDLGVVTGTWQIELIPDVGTSHKRRTSGL